MTEPTIIRIHDLTTQHPPMDGSPSFSSAQLYDSLPVDPGCIRVLDLEPEPQHERQSRQPVDSPLRGTLRVVSMKDCPDFTALSYIWGSKADPPDVLACNGCIIEITSNCKDALQAVRKSQGRITIWIDAICINQNDNLEKASQIPNMEDIFTWAQVVFVWLGRGNERTDFAMKMLQQNSRYSECLRGNRIRHADCRLASRGDQDLWTLCKKDLEDCWTLFKLHSPWHVYGRMGTAQRSFEYLDSLLSMSWISRAWTFQELILAQEIIIMCGKQSLTWDLFIRGMWATAHLADLRILATRLADDHETSHFRDWYAMITLWMNIKRNTTWGTRKMRCEHSGRATMANHQPPILSYEKPSLFYKSQHLRCARLSILSRSFVLNEKRVLLGAYLAVGILLFLPCTGVIYATPITLISLSYSGRYSLDTADKLGNAGFASVGIFSVLFGLWIRRTLRLTPNQATFGNRNEKDIDDVDQLVRVLPQVTKYRSSTEPRDRVYATYGILRSFDIQLSTITYTKSEDEVYLDFFLDLLRSSPKFLIFIIDAGLSENTKSPSWVPNWKTALERSWIPPEIYSSQRSEAAIASAHVQLAGKKLRVTGTIACEVGFATQTFKRIEDSQEDELAIKLEQPVATLCRLIHRARDLSYNLAYQTIIQSILQTINAFKPENEQFDGFHTFSSLYEKIRPRLRGVGDTQVDYMAISRELLHQCPEYPALAEFFNKFANRSLFDTLTGYLGSGPPGMKAGDCVVHVAGVSVPMIFRKTDTLNNYLVIGPAFVLGLMEEELRLSVLGEMTLV
ncbi:heterokaryon incompatibility protein-domain-containing protein [Xylaria curta]|nr:heterokaryon incompatibility protein-domain-containing protein [Xylaria curta]